MLYKNRMGFSVCGRESLHHCTFSFVTDAVGTATTIRIGPVGIDAVPSCDTIVSDAITACSDAGVSPMAPSGPTLPWLWCAARHGFLYRGGPNTTRLDPRDEEPGRSPGDARLQCDEGYKSGSFDDTL